MVDVEPFVEIHSAWSPAVALAPDAMNPLFRPFSEQAELDDAQAERLALLLTRSARPSPHRHIATGGRIRHFGHGCLVLQTSEGAVVTDPFIGADIAATDRYTPDDLPDFIDLVLVTQGHRDHLVLETLLQLRGRIGTVVAPRRVQGDPGGQDDTSVGRYLGRLGFPVVEAGDYDEFTFCGGRAVATPFLGECGEPGRGESTYWVELAGRAVFVGTDSSGVDPTPCRAVRQHLGAAHYAFLGMRGDGAPADWFHQVLLAQLGLADTREPRRPPGPSIEQASAMVMELGADEVYVHTVDEDPWTGQEHGPGRGHGPGPVYGRSARPAPQADEFLTWCAEHGITAGHLLRRQEWRW